VKVARKVVVEQSRLPLNKDGRHRYRVTKTVNTIIPPIGRECTEDEIRDLIKEHVTVEVKGAK